MPHDTFPITSDVKNTQHTCVQSLLAKVTPFVLIGSDLLDFLTRIISHKPDYEVFHFIVFH